MHKRYPVRLSAEDRDHLEGLIGAGTAPARKLHHARILLKADEGPEGPGWPDTRIAEAVESSQPTVSRVRKQYATQGLEAALHRRPPTREYRRKLDGAQEAQLVAVACSTPPAGQAHWSLRLLAAKLVELEVVAGIAPQTVATTLKKRDQAVAKEGVVHSSGAECRLRLADGGCAQRVYAPL